MRRGHRFRLDAQQLSDGVVSGSSSALRARLSSGAPITAVAIGASVALHGGCTDQPGSQCMLYRGVDVVDVGWGRRIRHKGFLVRWMDYINSTWPHPDHQLRNFASGGVALQTHVPCLFGGFPPRVDVAIIEVGSMAKFTEMRSIELVTRRLLSLSPQPTVLFVTVPLWYGAEFEPADAQTRTACQWRFTQPDFLMRGLHLEQIKVRPGEGRALAAASSRSGSKIKALERTTFGVPQRNRTSTPWSRAEAEVNRVCRHYNQSCISVYRALAPAIASRRVGFSMADVARDCVHPMHGRHGDAFVADLMVHWTHSQGPGEKEQLSSSQLIAAGGGRKSGAELVLPAPLRKGMLSASRSMVACFYVHADGARQRSEAHDTWLVAPWLSAQCAVGTDAPLATASLNARATQVPPAHGLGDEVGDGRSWQDGEDSAFASFPPGCHERPRTACPTSRAFPTPYKHILKVWRDGWPDGWVHCNHTISPTPRIMKNLAAFVPGAMAHLSLHRPAFLVRASEAATRRPAPARIRLLHLASYEHMGIVRASCVRGCTCRPSDIDAHLPARGGRNVSVYVDAELKITFPVDSANPSASPSSPRRCVLGLRVLDRTTSGGHRWVLTRVTVSNEP
jgi:hypothetical protein